MKVREPYAKDAEEIRGNTLKKLCGFRVIFALLAVNLLFLFSCATAPKIPDPFPDESGFLPLEPGASVYLLVDVPACRPILDHLEIRGMNLRQSREIFDRTRTAAAAFYPEGHERRFQAAAWGNYPGFRGNLALAAGKGWKKSRSKTGGGYYHSAGEGLSVALTASRAFVSGAGTGNRTDPFAEAPGTAAPEGFAEFRRGAALALWADDPGPPVNRFFETLGIPLRLPADRLFLSVFPVQEGEGADVLYEALIRIETPAASQARALFTLINMARAHAPVMEEAGAALAALLFANPPVQDGRNLNLRTAVMAAEEIALLFNIFSIYSDQT
jgi:hypothetical protein